jgi:hypothetical protein
MQVTKEAVTSQSRNHSHVADSTHSIQHKTTQQVLLLHGRQQQDVPHHHPPFLVDVPGGRGRGGLLLTLGTRLHSRSRRWLTAVRILLEKLSRLHGQLGAILASVGARLTMPAHALLSKVLGPWGKSGVHLLLIPGTSSQLETLQNFH